MTIIRTSDNQRVSPPRRVKDLPVEAYAAIITRHLGYGDEAPTYPELCRGWVDNFRETFQNSTTRPIETVFLANPMIGPNGIFDAVKEGEASYPLFALWRSKSLWKRVTNVADQNRVTLSFCWVLPPSSETERIWPLLGEFDFHLRRTLRGIMRIKDNRDLLNAALVRDYGLPWQSYESEQSYKGPDAQNLMPTLTGTFQFDMYWERTDVNFGLVLEAFNAARFNYFLRFKKESGSIEDAKLSPPLSSGTNPIPQGENSICPTR